MKSLLLHRYSGLLLSLSILGIFVFQTLKASELPILSVDFSPVNVLGPCNTPTITPNGSTQFCAGGSVVLSVPADTSLSYLWSTGARGNSITVTLSGSYSVVAISNTCTSSISTPIVVTVVPKASAPIISSVGGNTICNGNSITLNITNLQQSVGTIAGSGTRGYQDGQGSAATFNTMYANAIDINGNIFIADINNHRIRKVTPTGLVTTFAGNGVAQSVDGFGTSASIYSPTGLAFDASGNLYVSEYYGNKIRKINPSGMVTTIAGTGTIGFSNGFGSQATLYYPAHLAVYNGSTLLVTEVGNNVIRSIDLSTNIVTTFAGTGTGGYLDGPASNAQFLGPTGIAISPSNDVYITERFGHTIRMISNGVVSTIAGTSRTSGFIDGNGRNGLFNGPWGIAINTSGELFVGDATNHAIRKIDGLGNVTTIGGNGSSGFSDGQLVTSRYHYPYGLAFNQEGDLIVSEGLGNRLRKIDFGGLIFWNNGATSQSITVSTAANYTARILRNNCLSDTGNSIQIVAPAPLTVLASGPTTFCKGDSITLTSSENNVRWSTGQTTNKIVVKSPGTYRVTSNFGNCSRSSLPIVVNVNPSPLLNRITQVHDSVVVTYIPGVTYTWYLNGAWVPTSNTNKLQISTLGKYSVKASNSSGCSDSIALNVVVGFDNIGNSKKFSIYPNPTSNIIILDGLSSNNYQILNHLGQIITVGNYNRSISLEGLPKGMYWLKVAGYKTERFVKE